jgi:hypothetical protein
MNILKIKLNDKIDDCKNEMDKCEQIINHCKQEIDKCEQIINENKIKIHDNKEIYINLKWEKIEIQSREGPKCQSPEFKELPDEMILLIIEFMPINSICKFNLTCKRFQFTGNKIKEKLLKNVFKKMDEILNEKYFPINHGWNIPVVPHKFFLTVPSEDDILTNLNSFVKIIRSRKSYYEPIGEHVDVHYSKEETYEILDSFNEYLKKQNIFELFGEVK